MKYEIIRELDHNYLGIEMEVDREGDYELNVILDNDLKCFLPVTYNMLNGKGNFNYEISRKSNMTSLFPYQSMKLSDVRNVIEGITHAIETVKEYLLSPESIILEPDTIFFEEDKVYFCYLPSYHSDIRSDFKELAQFMLGHIDYQDELSVQAIYEINRRIMCEEFSIYDLLNYLEEVDGDNNISSILLKEIEDEKIVSEVKEIKSEKVFEKETRKEEIALAAEKFYGDGRFKRVENFEETYEDESKNKNIRNKILMIIASCISVLIIAIVLIIRNGGNALQVGVTVVLSVCFATYLIEKQINLIRNIKKKIRDLKDMGEDIEMIGWTEKI